MQLLSCFYLITLTLIKLKYGNLDIKITTYRELQFKMINPFLLNYKERLRYWVDLRDSLNCLPVKEQCIKVDQFWQKCPIVNYYLHPDDIENWPDPWVLIHDNTYCYYARALGIAYTLFLLGNKDIEIVQATDYNSNDIVLVLADYAKYVMNYWPESVLNSTLTDFRIKRHLDVGLLFKKINIQQ